MEITREAVAHKLAGYLHHEVSLADLVDWAESAMMEGEFEETHYDAVRNAVARLGLADVRAFGLTWEDCGCVLRELGWDAHVEIVAI